MKINKGTFGEICRFLGVGVINTLVGSLIMFLLYNLVHVNYWISSALNYVVGSICSFFLNKRFTFKSKLYSMKEVIRFVLNILVCYGVSYGLARPLMRLILTQSSTVVQENAAMLVGMGVFTVLNYFGQKLFVFTNKGGNSNE